MTYAALSLLAAVVARLPPFARAWLGGALGFFAGSVLRIRRTVVENAMDRAGVRAPTTVAARMYRELGVGIFELLWLAAARARAREDTIASVTIDDDAAKTLDEASARGPVILFASHTGNWELAAGAAARLLSTRGRRLVVVAKAMHERGVDAFLSRLRARLGIRVIAPRGAFSATRAALAAGDVVVMPIDQVPDRAAHGLPVRFLHETALADRAPATLAWRSRATVLVIAAERVGEGHRVRLLETIRPPEGRTRPRAWVDATTILATSALESFVLRSPASWLWLHRRWRAPRAARLVAQHEPS
jgi:KDO2-lipid IV(A) lauroyltransferase